MYDMPAPSRCHHRRFLSLSGFANSITGTDEVLRIPMRI